MDAVPAGGGGGGNQVDGAGMMSRVYMAFRCPAVHRPTGLRCTFSPADVKHSHRSKGGGHFSQGDQKDWFFPGEWVDVDG